MPRSGDEARKRLQQATLELFQERGYEAVTTAEIAARAGVTERTFFRHFPDKREALFDGEEAFRDALADAVAAAPGDLSVMEVLFAAFASVQSMLERNRPFTGPRHAIVAQTPALQERVLTKAAALTRSLAAALERRGAEPDIAAMAAQVGMAAFGHAARTWFEKPEVSLQAHLERAFQQLRDLAAPAAEDQA